MTPLEEQVEKLARRWEKEADEGELLDEVAYALEGAADELRALLPLEVTDEMVEAGAKANFEDRTMGREMEPWSEFKHDPRSEIWLRSARIVLSAALTQKGEA